VVANLLQNAVDATEGLPAERKRIIIRVGRAICAHAQVFIRDGGCGVAPADMPKLFDAFYTTKPKGLGIGLSISRSIIESHRGHLRASANSDGPGMTFEFTIPLVQETPV
jgi:signal transduction histidine kinase